MNTQMNTQSRSVGESSTIMTRVASPSSASSRNRKGSHRSGPRKALQLEMRGRVRFTDIVIRPTLRAPRGIARVGTLFESWLEWETAARRAAASGDLTRAALEQLLAASSA